MMAKDEQEKIADYTKLLKYSSLVILTILNAVIPLYTDYALTRSEPHFLKTAAVFFSSAFKAVIYFLMFFITEGISFRGIRTFGQKFSLFDLLKLCLPACLYNLQNLLFYVAVEKLHAVTFIVFSQLKILITALFTVLIMKRRLSIWQWLALLLLVVGAIIVGIHQYESSSEKQQDDYHLTIRNYIDSNNATVSSSSIPPQGSNGEYNLLFGVISVLIGSACSGFSGVFIESMLKKSDCVSMWMINFELMLMEILFVPILIAVYDGQEARDGGFLQGFETDVWVLIGINAAHGVVTSIVIKYADNILKTFSLTFGIILVTIAAITIFSIHPRLLFWLGASLVIIAVIIYSLFPYKKKQSQTDSIQTKSTQSSPSLVPLSLSD